MAADRHPDRSAGPDQFIGDLQPGLSRADDQDPARGQLCRVAVVVGVDRSDPAGQGRCERRDPRPSERAAGDDDGVGRHGSGRRLDDEAGSPRLRRGGRAEPRDRLPRADRGIEGPGIGFEVADHLGAVEEAVRVRPVVPAAGQSVEPIRTDQPERVPASCAPGVADGAAIEDQVLDSMPGQVKARRQARLAGADDDDGDRLQPISLDDVETDSRRRPGVRAAALDGPPPARPNVPSVLHSRPSATTGKSSDGTAPERARDGASRAGSTGVKVAREP